MVMEDSLPPGVDSPEERQLCSRSASRIQVAWRIWKVRNAGIRYTTDLLSRVCLGFTWRQRAKAKVKLVNTKVAKLRDDLARLEKSPTKQQHAAVKAQIRQYLDDPHHCQLGALLVQSAWRGYRARLARTRPKLSRRVTRPVRQESAFAAPQSDQDIEGRRSSLWVGKEFLSTAANRLASKSESSVCETHTQTASAEQSKRRSRNSGKAAAGTRHNSSHERGPGIGEGPRNSLRTTSFDSHTNGQGQSELRVGSDGSPSPSREPTWKDNEHGSRTSSSSFFPIWASSSVDPPGRQDAGRDETDVSPEAVEAASNLWTGENLSSYFPVDLSERLSTTTNWVTGFFSEEAPYYPGTNVKRIAVPGTRKLCNPRRVVIYFSDTGGGHFASASALKAAFDKHYGSKLQIEMIDFVRTAMAGPWKWLPEAYSLVGGWPSVYKMFFELNNGETDFRQTHTFTAMLKMNHDRALQHLAEMVEKGVDLIISVHPLINHLIMHCLEEIYGDQDIGVKVVTVVTDLGSAHLSWFEPRVDAIFVPSEMIRSMALEHHFDKEKIYHCGLPVREGFWYPTTRSKAELQAELLALPLRGSNGKKKRSMFSGGWSPISSPVCQATPSSPSSPSSKFLAHRVVLLMGGGEGFGSLVPLAMTLGERLAQKQLAQLVVICGRNEEVYKSLSTHQWPDTRGNSSTPIVLRFVSEMDLYMACADIVVTKAGPGTIAEAMIQGIPCLLTSFIPGQEEGNVTFVQEMGAGTFVSQDDPDKVAETVVTWLEDPLVMERMSAKARAASRPQATLEIAAHIGHQFLELQKPALENTPVSNSHARSSQDRHEALPARRRTVHINDRRSQTVPDREGVEPEVDHPRTSDLAEFSDFARAPVRTATDLTDADQKLSLVLALIVLSLI